MPQGFILACTLAVLHFVLGQRGYLQKVVKSSRHSSSAKALATPLKLIALSYLVNERRHNLLHRLVSKLPVLLLHRECSRDGDLLNVEHQIVVVSSNMLIEINPVSAMLSNSWTYGAKVRC